MKRVFMFLFLLLQLSEASAQANDERVIAEVRYSLGSLGGPSSLEPVDSVRYIYSGRRHSSFNHNQIGYIDFGRALGDVYPSFIGLEATRKYDSSYSEIPSFDTLKFYSLYTTGQPEFLCMQARTYNPDGTTKRVERLDSSGIGSFIATIREDISYQARLISKVYRQELNAGRWDTIYIRTVRYNGLSQVILDSTSTKMSGVFKPNFRRVYQYNSSGLPETRIFLAYQTTSLDSVDRSDYKYYPSGQLMTLRTKYYSPPSAGLIQRDSFSYTPGILNYTGRYNTIPPDTNNTVTLSMVNSKNQVDSITSYIHSGNTYVYRTAGRLTYNASGSPVKEEVFYLDAGTGAPLFTNSYINWYYEKSSVGVNDAIATHQYTITLSPNPTKGTIALHNLPNTPVTVLISNMMGQLLQKETIHAKGSDGSISLGVGIAPGIYTISVCGSNNSVLYRGTFLRQ